MTRILVIGGTGYAGSAIVREAAARAHDVTSVSRTTAADPVSGVRYLTATDLEAMSLIEGAEVVVASLSPRGGNAGTLVGVYLELASQVAKDDCRFIAIGGFSSLRPEAGAPRFAEGDGIPAAYADEAREMNSVLAGLRETAAETDWLFVSPASDFGAHAQGESLGRYRVGEDVVLLDRAGASAISGADFAKAVVDEIEKPTRRRAQVHYAYYAGR